MFVPGISPEVGASRPSRDKYNYFHLQTLFLLIFVGDYGDCFQSGGDRRPDRGGRAASGAAALRRAAAALARGAGPDGGIAVRGPVLRRTGGEVAGMLSLAWYDVPSGRCAWIEDVVVDAAARGRGAGRAQQWRPRWSMRAASGPTGCRSPRRPPGVRDAHSTLSCGFERCDTTLFRRRIGQ